MKNPYEVLGVSPSATEDEIKAAYRALAKKYHPDKYANSDLADLANEKMQEINQAYDTIVKGGFRSNTGSYSYGGGYTNSNYDNGVDYTTVINLLSANRLDDCLIASPQQQGMRSPPIHSQQQSAQSRPVQISQPESALLALVVL